MDAVSLLGAHPKELKGGAQIGACPSMFRAVLFTLAERWRQSKQIIGLKNMVYTYNK